MKADKTLSIKVKSKTERRIMEDPQVEMVTEWNIKRIVSVIIVFLLFIISAYYFSQKDDTDADKYAKSIVIENESNIKRPDSIKEIISEEVISRTPDKEIIAEESITQDSNKKATPEEVLEKNITVLVPPVKSTEKIYKEIPPGIVTTKELVQRQPPQSDEYLNKHITRARIALWVENQEPHGQVDFPLLVGNTKAEGFYYFTEVSNMKGSTVFHEWLREGKAIYKRKFVIRSKKARMSTSKLFTYRTTGQWQVRITDEQGEILHKINFSVERR